MGQEGGRRILVRHRQEAREVPIQGTKALSVLSRERNASQEARKCHVDRLMTYMPVFAPRRGYMRDLSKTLADSCVKHSKIENKDQVCFWPSANHKQKIRLLSNRNELEGDGTYSAPSMQFFSRVSEIFVKGKKNNGSRIGTNQWRPQPIRHSTEYCLSWVLDEVWSNSAEVLLLESRLLYAACASVAVRIGS